MRYHTIVVGGGMAGLIAAAYLAKEGKSVLLLEKQNIVGGLVTSFIREGTFYDGGIRSTENSGILIPMIRQLGLNLELLESPVSIGLGRDIFHVTREADIVEQYQSFLKKHFPEHTDDVDRIISWIQKIIKYMDILYGIDNPAFMNIREDRGYLFKTLLPWLFRYLLTYRKVLRLGEPVRSFLGRLSSHTPLIDNIAQHFFKETPTFFALSYFSLYQDYYYPKGGTKTLPDALERFILDHHGKIQTATHVSQIDVEAKRLLDAQGNEYLFDHLIWAADLKNLYRAVQLDSIQDPKLIATIESRLSELDPLRGGDSIFTIYLSVDLPLEFFKAISTGHFFYTPLKKGLSQLNTTWMDQFLNMKVDPSQVRQSKEELKHYLDDFSDLNTYEISIPALRDPSLVMNGRIGIIISLLFDYNIAAKLDALDWIPEMQTYLENRMIKVLEKSIYPDLSTHILDQFSSTPLTLEKMTGSTDGAITGWAFTNPKIPVVNQLQKVYSSVLTEIPDVFQAGQWTYSPSGLPIAILTGKLAVDKILGKKW
ncbi:phytoene desaturase family protein [Acidobacteriota bacterium]